MRVKPLAAIAGALLLVTATYALRSVTGEADGQGRQTAPNIEILPTSSALPEVNRLIALFEERVASRDDALDYRTLGRHYLELGTLTGDPGAYRDAVAVISESLDLSPGHQGALVDLTVASMGIHDFSGALESISDAVSTHPEDMRAQLILGDVLFALGRYGQAATQFDIVESAIDSDPAVLIRRAELAWHTGDNEGAINLSQMAVDAAEELEVDPRSLAFYKTEHGHHLINNGRIEEGIAVLIDAIETDSSWAAPKAELARAHHLMGAASNALQNIREALATTPDIEWQAQLVDILVTMGDVAGADSARETLARLVDEARPQGPVYARQVARHLADNGDPDGAVAIARVETTDRSDVYGLELYGWSLYRAGRAEEAWVVIEEVLAIGTQDPNVLYHAGVIAQDTGRTAQGRRYLSRALEVNPSFDPADAADARARLGMVS